MTALCMFIIALALFASFWAGAAVAICLGDWLSDRRRLL